MKKEIKKKNTTKTKKNTKINKKANDAAKDPTIDVSVGSLLVATNSFNSDIFLEKFLLFMGVILLIEGSYRLAMRAKKENNKSYILYLAISIIFIITFIILGIGSFIL